MPETLNQKPTILFPHFDGSGELCAAVQRFLALGYPVIVVSHSSGTVGAVEAPGCTAVDAQGGDGLRAGLQCFQEQMGDSPGVVVFEPDDGFSADDALRAAEAFMADRDKLVVASRRRNPKLGLFTNLVRRLAGLAFTLVHGRRVMDPWSSLKCLPARHVQGFLALKGDGCRLHMNILLNLQHMVIKTMNVTVDALYDYESGSRFMDRAVDIFKILLLPLKFLSASLAATVVDNTIFLLVTRVLLPGHHNIALTLCRSAGALTGYLLNRSVVFKRNNNTWKKELVSALQFALLALFNYGASLLLVNFLYLDLHINDFVAKLMTDMALFIVSFTVQREVIFRNKPRIKK